MPIGSPATRLFRVLTDVVEPKLAVEQRRLSDLVQELGPSPSASQRRTIDAQETFVDELRELRDELAAVAPLWAPDLNDGIVIVLAPLWRLFAHHRAWSNELKTRWKKLAAGDYDWAQLAMHLWPERVIPKCAEDRSLAIAHGLEDVFWVQDDDNPDKWHPRHTPTTPIDQLIAATHQPHHHRRTPTPHTMTDTLPHLRRRPARRPAQAAADRRLVRPAVGVRAVHRRARRRRRPTAQPVEVDVGGDERSTRGRRWFAVLDSRSAVEPLVAGDEPGYVVRLPARREADRTTARC